MNQRFRYLLEVGTVINLKRFLVERHRYMK